MDYLIILNSVLYVSEPMSNHINALRIFIRSSTDQDRSLGLVVIGGHLCSRYREFESKCKILDGAFFTFICCKTNEREACVAHLKRFSTGP